MNANRDRVLVTMLEEVRIEYQNQTEYGKHGEQTSLSRLGVGYPTHGCRTAPRLHSGRDFSSIVRVRTDIRNYGGLIPEGVASERGATPYRLNAWPRKWPGMHQATRQSQGQARTNHGPRVLRSDGGSIRAGGERRSSLNVGGIVAQAHHQAIGKKGVKR
jgi:hypothetical protein